MEDENEEAEDEEYDLPYGEEEIEGEGALRALAEFAPISLITYRFQMKKKKTEKARRKTAKEKTTRMTMMRNRRNFISFCKCAVTEEILKEKNI